MTDNASQPCECGCGERARPGRRFRVGHATRKTYTVDSATGCWIWPTGREYDDRPTVHRDGKFHLAYRWMFEQHVGPIPDGHHLHHTCLDTRCVNPDHLVPMPAGEHSSHHKAA